MDLLVADYGAFPGDGVDDLPALQRAVAALADGQRMVFEVGEYELDIDTDTPTLEFWGKTNIEIAGGGATLMLRGFNVTKDSRLAGALFTLGRSAGIGIHDLTIDMERPPFSQGTVTGVAADGASFELAVDQEYPVSADIKIEALLSYDAATGLPNGATCDRYFTDGSAVYDVAEVSAQNLRIITDATGLVTGERMVIRHNIYEYNAFSAYESTEVSLRDVTIYAVPGMGMYSHGGANLSVQRLQILARPGSGRLMSTTADGLNLTQTAGTLDVDDCLFESTGDDGMNLHSAWFRVVAVDEATNTLETTFGGPNSYARIEVGDRMEFADASLQFMGAATVSEVALEPAGQTLVLDGLPAGIAADWVVSNVSRLPSTVKVTDTTVRGNRARGLLVQGRHVLVDSCRFEYNTAAAVHVTTDLNTWFEGPSSSDVTISNCSILGVNRGAMSGQAAIWVFAELATGTPYVGVDAPGAVHHEITISGNYIADTPNAAVFIGSSEGVLVDKNQFVNVCGDPIMPPGQHPVYVRNSSAVTVTNNSLSLSPSALELGIEDSTGVTASGNDF